MALVLHEVQHGHGADGRQARGEVPEVREPVGVRDEEAGEVVPMTATDELRAMLDERGVDWGTTKGCDSDSITTVHVDGRFGGTEWEAFELADGTFQVTAGIYDELTPEQFLAATLGAGTCKPEKECLDSYGDLTVTVCSNCRVAIDDLEDCHYCPNCGAKVVDA